MFEFIRKHSKYVMVLLFLLVIPSFVFFGIDGYKRSHETGKAVASVDGSDITQGEWDAAHRQNMERMRAQIPGVDAKLLDSPASRFASLEQLVRERVLQAVVIRDHLAPSDARLAHSLEQDPTIAAMRGANGVLDMAQYRQVLAAQGMTPESFESNVRRDLALRQVIGGVAGSSFVPAAEANVVLAAIGERREIQTLLIQPADFAAKVLPTDAQIGAYYEAHQSEFRVAEHASINYVVLDLEAVEKTITVSDADLRTLYAQKVALLANKEERRASHILITVAKDAPTAEVDQAKARAQALLTKVRAQPEQFAEIARKNSQDPGSAAKGGDLDFFSRNAMVKPFEDAAYALKKGEISDLVRSDFGFHIIKLTDIRTPVQPSFEAMKSQLQTELKKQAAQKKFAEDAEVFTNTVYEQSDSLKPVADRLQLKLQTASDVKRFVAPGTQGVLANAKLLETIFSPDSIEKKRNTEAVEIAPNKLVAARITDYAAARTPALVEVRAAVKAAVSVAESAKLAQAAGEKRLLAIRAAPAQSTGFGKIESIARNQPGSVPLEIVRAAMMANTAVLPNFLGVKLQDGGYAVVKVDKVIPAAMATATPQERAQVSDRWAAAVSAAYYETLKRRMKTDIKVPKPVALGTERS